MDKDADKSPLSPNELTVIKIMGLDPTREWTPEEVVRVGVLVREFKEFADVHKKAHPLDPHAEIVRAYQLDRIAKFRKELDQEERKIKEARKGLDRAEKKLRSKLWTPDDKED